MPGNLIPGELYYKLSLTIVDHGLLLTFQPLRMRHFPIFLRTVLAQAKTLDLG